MLIRPDVKVLEESIRKHALAAVGKYCEFLGIPKLDRPNKGRLVELIEEAILDAMHERDERHKRTQTDFHAIALGLYNKHVFVNRSLNEAECVLDADDFVKSIERELIAASKTAPADYQKGYDDGYKAGFDAGVEDCRE